MSNTNIKKVRTSDLELKDRLVSINRVTKVTKGGRTFSFSAIVVVGNENGVVGYGLGKASEVTSAIAKGVEDAKKNLVKVPVINGTIPHKQEMRFGGSLVMIAKGNRTQAVTDACKKHGGFYLGTIGGVAAVLSASSIKSIECVEWPELGMEAVYKIEVVDFPAFILVDDKGNDFFKQLKPRNEIKCECCKK